MVGHAEGYLARAKPSRGTRPRNLPSDITSSARDASGSIFSIWYNPFLRMIFKIFHNQKHKKLMRYWSHQHWQCNDGRYRWVPTRSAFLLELDLSVLRFATSAVGRSQNTMTSSMVSQNGPIREHLHVMWPPTSVIHSNLWNQSAPPPYSSRGI